MFEKITFNEYKQLRNKMTKVEKSFYQHNFKYETMFLDEEMKKLIEKEKNKLLQTKEKILREIRANKILKGQK